MAASDTMQSKTVSYCTTETNVRVTAALWRQSVPTNQEGNKTLRSESSYNS